MTFAIWTLFRCRTRWRWVYSLCPEITTTFPELSPYHRQPGWRVSPHFSFPPTAAPRWGEVTQFLTFRVWCTLFWFSNLTRVAAWMGFQSFLRLISNSQVFPPFGLSDKLVTGWVCLPCIPLGIYLPVELLDHITIIFPFLYTFWASWIGSSVVGARMYLSWSSLF